MSGKFRVLVVIVAIAAISPLVAKYALKSETGDLERQKIAYDYAINIKNSLLKASIKNEMSMRDPSRQDYFLFRENHGVEINWNDGKYFGLFGESAKDKIRKQIIADSDGLAVLTKVLALSEIDPNNRSQLTKSSYIKVSDMARICQAHSNHASKDAAILLANPLAVAVAYFNNQKYKGINVRDYIYNNPEENQRENINNAALYFEHYKEYWLKFIFDDDFYDKSLLERKQSHFKYMNYK